MKQISAILLLLSLTLLSCTSFSLQAVPTVTPILKPISVTENNCNKELAMYQATEFFRAFPDYSVVNRKINNISILTAWIVLDINPHSSNVAAIEKSAQTAMMTSLLSQASLVMPGSCIPNYFTHIEIIIADKEYNGWVSQMANIKDVPTNLDINNIDYNILTQLSKKIKVGYYRTEPTENLLPTNEQPSWNEIRQTIKNALPNKSENFDLILIVDTTGIDVSAQWQEPSEGSLEFKEVDMQTTVQKIVAILNTMKTKPNLLEFTVVDKDGKILKMGKVPELNLAKVQVLSAPFNVDLNAP